MVALRGVENGYAVVRPSRRSRSAAYDAYGREIARAEWADSPEPVVTAEVPMRGIATFYARTGDWFPVATLALLVALLAWPAITRRRIAQIVRSAPGIVS